jgi:molybdenum cofactor synthesis domain-containing protein
VRVAILTISDSCAEGAAQDRTGPEVAEALVAEGAEITEVTVVPDELDRIRAELVRLCDEVGADVVFTNGGTGFGPRDVTPEATEAVLDRRVPGIPEAMRSGSLTQTPNAMLSRAVAGLRGRSLIVNLPGSPRGARQCLDIVLPVLDHALAMIAGGGHQQMTS